jgi:hypothetical protein
MRTLLTSAVKPSIRSPAALRDLAASVILLGLAFPQLDGRRLMRFAIVPISDLQGLPRTLSIFTVVRISRSAKGRAGGILKWRHSDEFRSIPLVQRGKADRAPRERQRRLGFSALVVAAPILLAATAHARSNGIIGYSGAQKITCNSHHAGGVAPVVHFEGPLLVAADRLVTFRFVVESQGPEQIAAGLDVAVSGGALVTFEGQRTRVEGGELTHTQPQSNDDGGVAAWTFAWRAPRAPGAYVFFGCGNSVDSFFDQAGDRAATATLEVDVGCQADCDLNGAVSVADVIRTVSIAQGTAPPDACPLADGDGDGAVSVTELVTAVRNALRGCVPAPAVEKGGSYLDKLDTSGHSMRAHENFRLP